MRRSTLKLGVILGTALLVVACQDTDRDFSQEGSSS